MTTTRQLLLLWCCCAIQYHSSIISSYSLQPSFVVARPPQRPQPQEQRTIRPKQSNRLQPPRTTATCSSRLSVATTAVPSTMAGMDRPDMPERGKDGVYHVMDQPQFRALLDCHKDKLVVLKVFAPWCKACKGLEPKFNALVRDEKYQNLPIVWASLTIQNNKDFVKSIGVLALPTIQFYARGQKMETFACGPSKVPILKRKLVQFVNTNVDAKTYQLKEVAGGLVGANATIFEDPTTATAATDADNATTAVPKQADDDLTLAARAQAVASPTATDAAQQPPPVEDAATPQTTPVKETTQTVVERKRSLLRSVKYLSDLLESEFESLLSKAALLTFESGAIIMREGNVGRLFYVILDGEVEICQRTSFEDPLTTPSSYLGTVINREDTKGGYFGERSLITGEPRAASIRASQRTTCLAFDKDDFPKTSVLSGHYVPAETLDEVNDKYGKNMMDVGLLTEERQYQDSVKASQIRGSPNTPDVIDGVDNDKEITEEMMQERLEKRRLLQRQQAQLQVSEGLKGSEALANTESMPSLGVTTETVIPLLVRFKLIRDITRCFDYIVQNRLQFGDAGTRRRRAMLAHVLSPLQRQEIADAFKLIDEDGDEEITLIELRRLLSSIGEERTDQELLQVIESSHFGDMDDKKVMTAEDFSGLMAEAEIYHLFLDTFKSMDPRDTGFVRAKDLDRVLCGIRDLISDDRRSIIDVDDKEMMVDYEQFSRMLLGSALNP